MSGLKGSFCSLQCCDHAVAPSIEFGIVHLTFGAFYYENGLTYPAELDGLVHEGISRMEALVGRKFGDVTAMPLLVSVRSGARESMPGMMDTILNLGLNDETVEAMAAATNNPRFAWDLSSTASRRRAPLR